MIKNKSKIILFIISLLIFSCQKVEILDPIVFDYTQFSKISINVEKKNTIAWGNKNFKRLKNRIKKIE